MYSWKIPKNAKLLNKDASPIIWGYEPSHPYEEQAKAIAECGLKFCLAPGTATWRTFTGRWPTARDNIAHAVENACQYKAEGTLLTSWGDCGNHQPWATIYPGILYGAQMMWAGSSLPEEQLGSAMDGLVFGKPRCRSRKITFGNRQTGRNHGLKYSQLQLALVDSVSE